MIEEQVSSGDAAPFGFDGPRTGPYGSFHRVLTPDAVPPADADIDTLLDFGLTFDAVAHWGSESRCEEVAACGRAQWARGRGLPSSTVALRTCLFVERSRYTPSVATELEPPLGPGDAGASAPDQPVNPFLPVDHRYGDPEGHIRALVEEIRSIAEHDGRPDAPTRQPVRDSDTEAFLRLLGSYGVDGQLVVDALPDDIGGYWSVTEIPLHPPPIGIVDDEFGLRQILIGEPPLAVVSFHDSGTIDVAECVVWWDGHTPRRARRLETLQVLDGSSAESSEAKTRRLCRIIEDTIHRRRERFERCRACGRELPPEHMHDDDTCQGCAQRDFGVVY